MLGGYLDVMQERKRFFSTQVSGSAVGTWPSGIESREFGTGKQVT